MRAEVETDWETPVVLVLAVSENGVIGRGDGLPWDLPDDLAHFKRTTLGRPVIMGRVTFDTVGKPLPGRTNIVVTRDADWCYPGVHVAHSVEAAIALADSQALIDGADAAMVVGGAEIYRLALPYADRVVLTRVHGDVDGDTFFDLGLLAGWQCEARTRVEGGDRNSHDFSIEIWIPGSAASGPAV